MAQLSKALAVCLFALALLTICGQSYSYFIDTEHAEFTISAGVWEYGCSHGFWKTEPHSNEWDATGYSTDSLFNKKFDVEAFAPHMSLMDALWLEGGQEDALAREAVAALLNAAHPDVDFGLTEDAVMEAVCEACETGDYQEVKDELEGYNTAVGGCPL